MNGILSSEALSFKPSLYYVPSTKKDYVSGAGLSVTGVALLNKVMKFFDL